MLSGKLTKLIIGSGLWHICFIVPCSVFYRDRKKSGRTYASVRDWSDVEEFPIKCGQFESALEGWGQQQKHYDEFQLNFNASGHQNLNRGKEAAVRLTVQPASGVVFCRIKRARRLRALISPFLCFSNA